MRIERLRQLFGIEGKIAVITDSGGLSSKDVGPVLADAGAAVIVADSDTQSANAIVEQIKSTGGQAQALATNIEKEAEVVALFERVRKEHGRCDILVNCAGVNANQPITDTTTAVWDEVYSVNARATFLCMREAVKLMLEAGNGGRIVSITTIGSERPVLYGNGAYNSSRGAVTLLTRSTAYDYAKHGILANVILPGAVVGKTRFHETTLARLQAGGSLAGSGTDPNHLPLGMMKDPTDIGAAVLFLVGPSASYITGATLALDGGFLIA
jgi:NAD(P)-dependent dehydrogenase (short-subunit alcohol dehydrogenase family)